MITLAVKELEVLMFLGIYDFEKLQKTRVLFNLKLNLKVQNLNEKNDLQNLLNYDDLVKKIKLKFENSNHDLIEDVIFEIGELLKPVSQILSAEVEVLKFGTHAYVSVISIAKFFDEDFFKKC